MATQYLEIPEKQIQFISQQKIFFVATAASDGRVNVSPKGMDSLRVINKNRVIWLNVTGRQRNLCPCTAKPTNDIDVYCL